MLLDDKSIVEALRTEVGVIAVIREFNKQGSLDYVWLRNNANPAINNLVTNGTLSIRVLNGVTCYKINEGV